MRRRASAPKRVRRALARDGDHDARLAPLERLPRGGGLTCERRGLRPGDVLLRPRASRSISCPRRRGPRQRGGGLTSTSPSDGPVRRFQLPIARCAARCSRPRRNLSSEWNARSPAQYCLDRSRCSARGARRPTRVGCERGRSAGACAPFRPRADTGRANASIPFTSRRRYAMPKLRTEARRISGLGGTGANPRYDARHAHNRGGNGDAC